MANRYWVGGGSSSDWDATGPTNWSASSGGSNNASVPASSDAAYFDANSGTGNAILSSDIVVAALICTGYTGTITHNNNVTLFLGGANFIIRSFILSRSMTYSIGGTSATIDIIGANGYLLSFNSAGHQIGRLEIDGSPNAYPEVRLLDDLNVLGVVKHTYGFLNLNGFSLTCSNLESTSSTRRSILSGGNAVNTIAASATPSFNYFALPVYGGTGSSLETSQQQAQSFNVSSDTIYGVSVYLTKNGTPTDNFVVSLRSTIDGSDIVSKSVSASDIVTDTYHNIIFDTPATVSGGSTYFLVFSRSGTRDATNYCSPWVYILHDSITGSSYQMDDTVWGSPQTYDLQIVVYERHDVDITVTGTGDVIDFVNNTNMYISGDFSITINNNSSTAKLFKGGGYRYKEVYNNTSGTGTLTFVNSNSFDTLRIAAGRANLFTNGTTQTVSNLVAGTDVSLRSSSNGSTWSISSPSGVISVESATLRDSIATGGATFKALISTDGGNNTGWTFIDAPTVVTSSPQTIATYNALGLANITDDAGYTLTRRGFVWSTTSYADPGNIEPSASSYPNVTEETGTFTEGAFTRSLFSLNRFTTYYYRGFAEHNEGVIGYGDEVAFTTIKNGLDVDNTSLSTATPTNQITTAQTLGQPSVSTVSPATETTTASAIINETTNPVTINGT